MTRRHVQLLILVLASILDPIPLARGVPDTSPSPSPPPPSPSPPPPAPNPPPPSPPAYGYSDGITYTTKCDATFSEPGACDFTPLAFYPNSSTWLDSVSVPQQYQNQPRTYRNLFPTDFYLGSSGTQCGGTNNCANNHIEGSDCKPDPSNGTNGTSWWGQDLPWPNARCGDSASDFTAYGYWCQRASAESWLCATGKLTPQTQPPPTTSQPPSPNPPPPSPSPPPPNPSPPPMLPSCIITSSPAFGYTDGEDFTDSTCDETFSEPGACFYTPLDTYPNSSSWLDGVAIPAAYENQKRNYRNLFPPNTFVGGVGTQCGGPDNCANANIQEGDCKPDPQNCQFGTSWWGQDLPWPNIRCGNNAADFAIGGLFCQKATESNWQCAQGTVTVITFQLVLDGIAGGNRRLLSTNFKSSLELAIATQSRVPLTYVNATVNTLLSGTVKVPSTQVTSNVIFTNPQSASTFLNTVNKDPSVILSASTDIQIQALARAITGSAGTSSRVHTGSTNPLAIKPSLPPLHDTNNASSTSHTPPPLHHLAATLPPPKSNLSSSARSKHSATKVGVILIMLAVALNVV